MLITLLLAVLQPQPDHSIQELINSIRPRGLIIVSLSGARAYAGPTKAVVLFDGRLQLWEGGRYATYWQFVVDRGQTLPNGEYTLIETEIVDPSSAPPFCRLTLESKEGVAKYRLRVYWHPEQLAKWLVPGIKVDHPACLL